MPEQANLHLYDTLTRTTQPVQPSDTKTLRFYCCGPTVYGPAHIGNFRTFIVQDVFRRVVELSGTPTLHVRNITDVDDKTIRDSQKAGQSLTDFTELWTKKFHQDCRALALLAPQVEPRATEHIPHQIRMIEALIASDHAYASPDGSVYFRVGSYQEYGRLSRLDERELRLGSAQTATDSDEYSKDSLADFALWKGYKAEDGDNAWDSPWGRGRPGWHLECSAMALEYLGEDFDLHGGGIDLIFPHHENEIAQSCCSTKGHFARLWMHAAHLMVDGGKMSKSLGNLYTLGDLQHRGFTPAEVRHTLLNGHYRQPLNFTLGSLDAARETLQKLAKFEKGLREAAGGTAAPSHDSLVKAGAPGPFEAAWKCLLDDLNVTGSLGQVFGVLKKAKPATLTADEAKATWTGLHFILDALGLELPPVREDEAGDVPEEIRAMAEQRWNAKQAKDWSTADEMRKAIELEGWVVKDRKDGWDLVRQA